MAHFSSLSMAAQSWYYDLLSLLLDEEISDIKGSIIEKKKGNRTYLYDNYRLGSKTVQKFIGLKTDALLERLSGMNELKEKREIRRKARSSLVKKLRTEKVLSPDVSTGKVLSALASAGAFRLGGTLVGTNAFRAYELELGVRFNPGDAIGTMDLDIAGFERFSIAVDDVAIPDIPTALTSLGYDPAPSLDEASPWRWINHKDSAVREVEFLTPCFDEAEHVKYLEALQVNAQSLHYLNFLLRDAIDAALLYRDGILVKVPRPERYAIHKLIVASRRDKRGILKSRKDLLQAGILMEILHETRPGDLSDAYEEAFDEGSAWRTHIDNSFEKAPYLRRFVA
ncbi:nucleotidyltransferase family protein [Thalassospira xiamenensis]|uniref:nucleotidyltransferase family protein n=1 Tax=Thalassospira xiamenensis TaxID=220697 RepID=UPI000DEDC4AD|nr:GSU2403 family nucleotidyltransferase fold protein [Thalassospira xiamenensis]RCK37278.1 hypothetical protein TH24_17035 [Thalassospira xiamenensis]